MCRCEGSPVADPDRRKGRKTLGCTQKDHAAPRLPQILFTYVLCRILTTLEHGQILETAGGRDEVGLAVLLASAPSASCSRPAVSQCSLDEHPCQLQFRLWSSHMGNSTDAIALGITEDHVALGSHLIHFWQNEEEFERGVRFLQLGIENESQYCVLFGHDEANQQVLEILRKEYPALDRVVREGRLVILRREGSASETLAKIEAAFEAAVAKGAEAIRYLGNLGTGQAPLPGRGADEVIELENGATDLGRHYPCVIVCMYDVNTLSGRLVLQAGFGTHGLAVCGHALKENSYFVPHQEAPRSHRASR
jgi:MEDS: MEthanogen/methylotroph, DcmR Sensory domain